MPVRISQDTVVLSGVVVVEDAEPLHLHLLAQPHCTIAYETLEHLHAAVLQVLMAHGKALPENLFPRHSL